MSELRTIRVSRRTPATIPSLNCTTDGRTALALGLKEYLEQLVGNDVESGRAIRFESVLHTWAESEIPAEYPGACVYSTEEHTYEPGSGMTPKTVTAYQYPTGELLIQTSEINYTLTIEVYCTDSISRMCIAKMLEDGLNPEESQYGVTLEFPHYYNSRGTFELLRGSYSDDSESIQRRLRKATFAVAAAGPVYRIGPARKRSTDIRTPLTVLE